MTTNLKPKQIEKLFNLSINIQNKKEEHKIKKERRRELQTERLSLSQKIGELEREINNLVDEMTKILNN
jgi:hypothetical protein